MLAMAALLSPTVSTVGPPGQFCCSTNALHVVGVVHALYFPLYHTHRTGLHVSFSLSGVHLQSPACLFDRSALVCARKFWHWSVDAAAPTCNDVLRVSRVSLSGASRQYPRPARANVPLWHPCARPADRRSVRWCGSRVRPAVRREARGPAGPGPRPSASPVAGSGALWVWPMPATADTRSEGDCRGCIVYSAVQLYNV